MSASKQQFAYCSSDITACFQQRVAPERAVISVNREVISNASTCPGGEIEGTVYLTRNGRTVPAGRVTVEVVDDRNHVVNSTTTEYDGFYVISRISLGKYRIRVFTATDERTEFEN